MPTFSRIEYKNVWDDIDLSVSHEEKSLKMNWTVRPNANLENIRLQYEGVDSIEIDEVGNLIIKHELGEIKDNAPVSYQVVNGSRVDINCKFKIFSDMTVGFEIGENYNPSYDLVIDPLLPYSSYLGGDAYDTAGKVSVDSQGCAYISGNTQSMNFPTTPGAFRPNFDPNNSDEIFVTKVSADGSELIYSTFLDEGGDTSVFVDKNGYAYISGYTDSENFPTTPNAFQENSPSSTRNGFVTKLSPSGSELIYSTYLGGNNSTRVYSIVVDEAGYAYVCGMTLATNFPTTPGAFDTTPRVDTMGFVTKLAIDGESLEYSTFLKGSDLTYLYDIAVDSTGHAYVTGYTWANDYPTTSDAFQLPNNAQGETGIITKLSPDGSTLEYSTYLGGTNRDRIYNIAVDSDNNIYVAGETESSDFPVTPGAYQPIFGGGSQDIFCTKLYPGNSELIYSTFIGGSGGETYFSMALDAQNQVWLLGWSGQRVVPATPWIIPSGASGAFVALLSKNGDKLILCYYLSGVGAFGQTIAVGDDGCIYVAGTNYGDYSTTLGVFQPLYGGGGDAFIQRNIFATYSTASVMLKKI